MSARAADIQAMVTALQEDFDRGFSLPLAEREAAPRSILRVVAAGRELAIQLEDISGMQLDPHLARVPAAPSHLLGLTGARGRTWPVYDLGVLLGHARGHRPRVLCLMREPSVALACEAFRGLLHVRPSAIVDAPPTLGSSKAVQIGEDFIRLLDPSGLVYKN